MATARKVTQVAEQPRPKRGRPVETERKKALRRLSKAIANACDGMDPVKRGFVESEFESYRWNSNRLDEVEAKLKSAALDLDERKDLRTERHQLVTEGGQLFGHLMRQLKDADGKPESDPLAEFLAK